MILRSYHGVIVFLGLFAIVATMFMRLNPVVPIALLILLVGYGVWVRKSRER
jgi:uncharacterized membrane protein HdeD (DUF308 family)